MAPREAKAQIKEVRVPMDLEAGNGGPGNYYAIFNNTLVHITDKSGAQTSARANGVLKVPSVMKFCDEVSAYDIIVAAQDVGVNFFRVTSLHIILAGTGGPIGSRKTTNSRCGAQCILRALNRTLDISCIEAVTPVRSGSPRRNSGRRCKRS